MMDLGSAYKQQLRWREWPAIFESLPAIRGQLVLDLGCAVGDQAAELVARGARVVGIDGNADLLREAKARSLPGADFRANDLAALPDLGLVADGIWCSFTAAYFPDLSAALASWARHLRAGGWIALTEVDDLFGHEPLSARTKAIFDTYAREALQAKRYDFHMGRKLPDHLEAAGFTVSSWRVLGDQELSFSGPARPDVLEAWRSRLDRMKLLRDLCGAAFEDVREELLACLRSPDHRSGAKVYCCIATRGVAGGPP